MSDDFYKGMANDSSNISNHSEWYRGNAYQTAANAPKGTASPHSSGFSLGSSGGGMVITGESPILKAIVSIPFLVAGALLYPATAALTLVAGLLCVRLLPLLGSGWVRWLAYIPMLVVFWISMRWDVRMGERHRTYRRVRHVARLVVFAVVGYLLAGAFFPARGTVTLPHVGGALAGGVLGHFFLTYGNGWRDFWYRTLAMFRLRPAE